MKYLGTHHDTGVKLPTVGNAIWLSFYLGQYHGNFNDFLLMLPRNAGSVQKDVYMDDRSYYDQLVAAKGVDLIVLCVRCLEGEIDHFLNYYKRFSQDLCEYVYKLGYKNVKVELMSEPIEIVTPDLYLIMLKRLRKVLDRYRKKYNLQILAGAGDLHHKQHKDYYKYLRDHAFHDFDCWSIHCINDPLQEMIWAVKNLGDKPIHITEFTTLDHLLAWGASDPITLWFLNECITFAQKQSKIKSLLQVFPAYIEGKYKSWSIHKSSYLTKLREFYNKYIKEENMSYLTMGIYYGEKGAAVQYLQHLLLDNEHDPGVIDGIFGKNTLAALNEFQKNWNISVVKYCDMMCLLKFLKLETALGIIVNQIIDIKMK